LTADAGATRPARTGWIIFAALAALYLASLAPRATFWDAGEFIAAIESWGIPHPPGTPLYVTLGRALRALFDMPAAAMLVNALSALGTAAGCALGGTLLARRGVPPVAAIAAGICAGCMTSVWLSATEAEVYSASLLLSALMLVAGASAASAARAGDDGGALKRHTLLAYLFALAAPLHPSALVAGPAAIWLSADYGAHPRLAGRARRLPVAVLVVSLVAAGALATGRYTLAAAGAAALAAIAAADAISRRGAARMPIGAGRALCALALGASPLFIMMLRASFDPAVNQGAPATWAALGDQIARRQYEVQGLWPRQAPAWMQLANLFQYADWQFALGVAPESTASVPRMIVSLAFVALGVIGARAHRRRDEGGFRAMLVLLLSGSLGVAAYLNLKAGPSIGWGILPDSMPHEARERDYFFVLAFWAWGLWAGMGAVALAEARLGFHRARAAAVTGLAIAALPALFNWRAMNRRREPDATTASLLATAMLASAPPNGVLIVWGDNDSYPLWEAQVARGVRRDVTVVTSPLLGATWYRDELRRRWAIDPGELAAEASMVAHAIRSARPRPVAIAVTVPAEVRARVGGQWKLCGLAWIDQASKCSFTLTDSIARFLRAHPVGRFTDNTVRSMLDPLRCPLLASRAAPDSAAADSLAGACNAR
jgi:hypothetical protein